MNIVIDARWIFPEISGIGEYTRELIREFAQRAPQHTFTLLFHDPVVMERTVRDLNLASTPHMRPHRFNAGVFSLRSQLALPSLLSRLRTDAYHSPNFMIPLAAFPRRRRGRIGCVVTIHDVIPLLFPDHAPRSRKSRFFPVYRRLMREIGTRADRILTVSAASASDIVRQLAIPPDEHVRVESIHNGVAARFQPPAQRPAKAATEERRLLYVGRADPYKNLGVLIEAYARARTSLPFPSRLYLAGSPDARYPEAGLLAARLGIADAVQWLGYVDDRNLVKQYQEADVLVHPSRYEGFGLQVVEAMACGTPVVCSNASALPEVAGDAARFVEPNDVDGFAREIVAVLTDPALATTLSQRGPIQAARFTWRTTAERTLAVYEDLARTRP